MIEGWFSGVAPLALFAAAYGLGLATGWMTWGGRGAGAREAPHPDASTPAAEKLEAVAEDVKAAQAALGEDGDLDDISQELGRIDGALKRANGRLKLISRAVRK